MNYPVWELYASGGGLLIAMIAILHVYIAHFAVGGGLYLVLCEYRAHHNQQEDLFAYLQKHARFFMLLTMVLGGMTGVGIWFTMALLSPEASSILIHQFVFAWAVEWLLFTGEIIALFIYYYTFNRVQSETHIRIGWFYFGFAWLSLFMINGIVSFMLTPGQWLETGNFWHGFFNPGFFPSLLFRTALTLVFAGIFGLLTAATIEKDDLRTSQIRYCGKWILTGLLLLPVFAHFYFYSLPNISEIMITGGSPEIQPFVGLFLLLFVMLLACGGMVFLNLSQKQQKIISYSLLIMGLLYMGSFEWIREAARKPYIIHNYLYANQLYKKDTKIYKEQGILKTAKWAKNKIISPENMQDAGHELFLIACSSCHSVGGPMNDILSLTQKYSLTGMEARLIGQGKITPYMPEFHGTSQERSALAQYIVHELNQQTSVDSQPLMLTLTHSQPTFNPETQDFILMAWPNKGMHLYSGSSEFFELGRPSGKIEAQLIRRGELPEHVMDGVELIYRCDSQNINGSMTYDDMSMTFVSENLQISEFDQNNQYNPYPIIFIEAWDSEKKTCMAKTQMVFAVSSSMGCKNCHGGSWKNGHSGLSEETAEDILRTHDRISGTALARSMKNGNGQACTSCHPSTSSKDKSGKTLTLSASMHGFHANYIDDPSAKACLNCHAAINDTSLCYRGIHAELDVSCVNCHGSLSDHALSLLVHENANGKDSAQRYINHLKPKCIENVKDILPRKPWIQEPDCMTCHINYKQPDSTGSGFNQWTSGEERLFRNQMGDAGIRCTACHGAPHVIYPSKNLFDPDRDHLQPLQYQSSPVPIGGDERCSTCHRVNMDTNYHHENMLQTFRNVHLIEIYQ
ncbi:MAG: cytochrome ubiquinol oxidase subunit I [Candidatus Magnetomorum sp.]|nr:cytochrome ubiquinol oxidase subunit I [Candidatus Magnetomorum sp.]